MVADEQWDSAYYGGIDNDITNLCKTNCKKGKMHQKKTSGNLQTVASGYQKV